MKFNINKKTDLTFYLGKICHYFILNGRLPILTFYRQRIDESLLLGKRLIPKKFQPRFTNLIFAGFSVFF